MKLKASRHKRIVEAIAGGRLEVGQGGVLHCATCKRRLLGRVVSHKCLSGPRRARARDRRYTRLKRATDRRMAKFYRKVVYALVRNGGRLGVFNSVTLIGSGARVPNIHLERIVFEDVSENP